MASASWPSAVSRMKSARLVCMVVLSAYRLPMGIHAAAIKNAAGIETAFQLAMNFLDCRRERLKYANVFIAASKQGGMAANGGYCRTYGRCIGFYISFRNRFGRERRPTVWGAPLQPRRARAR